MARTSGDISKQNIILKSFALFSSRPYDQVTFDDIGKISGLSRGAILYHFKTKQEIFNEVVESSLLNRTVFLDIPIRDHNPLENFILDLIESCKTTIKEMKKQGINNINKAHYTIEFQALYFYDHFDKLSKQMRSMEIKVWSQVIKKAQDLGELKKDIDCVTLGTLFLNTYYGHAYASAKDEKGCDVELLHKEMMLLRSICLNN